ncbi:flavodoxin domain-containing protein [Exiguobacterium aurantiacum]|uniref:Protoporphyrinogen IX dehydrogenase [menaquinone] n=1 Tax=Exiguobacterium aurantiacum TaxID=33987 RepID=A0A377FX65_9BACL|nr:flavodoxin domain-containing protein [Exiguobacterium aurantiacum]STO09442.1 Protoporphyrinogen IX dehydrogenase [menaquinone] [Exiguobacterium aurantiacum]
MKTLIAYTSRYGTSEKVAHLLAERLSGNVHVQNLVDEPGVDWGTIDHVIVGGSIRMGKVQDELTDWLKQNEGPLLERPLGLYLCAGTPTAAERQRELEGAYGEPLWAHAYFVEVVGSGYDFERMGFLDKAIVRMMAKQTVSSLNLDEARLDELVESAQASLRTRSENP